MKILVVEDDGLLSQQYCDSLEQAGFETVVEEHSERVLEVAKLHAPGLIFLDLILPGKGGLHALMQLKNDPATSNIPVVVLTNIEQEVEKEESMNMGAAEYVLKRDASMEDIVALAKKYEEVQQ